MRSVYLTEPFKFETRESENLKPAADEVLLKIDQVGICGSDILIYHGQHKFASMPLVMGHECAASVEEIGEDVHGLSKGDLVTVQPQLFCGKCYACRRGSTNVCEKLSFMGVHKDGFFREYAVVPSWNVIKLPPSFTVDAAMLVEPLAVAANAARKGRAEKGSRAVVIGAGGIGNLTAQALMAHGVDVMIADIQDYKLSIAKECGIPHCVNTLNANLKEEIYKSFNGEEADVIYDCAAVPAVMRQIIECAANSSTVVVVGNYKEPVELMMSMLQRREIALLGVMQYTREDFLKAVDLLESGRINIDGIIARRYPLENIAEAFKYIDDFPREIMKVAIERG
jgi:L-iditol 2-dehydrogenase